jgi:hypothetical protein
MRARGIAVVVVAAAFAAPFVTGGGAYLGLLRELRIWLGGAAFLSFATVHFLLRRVAELGLRRPGACLRASAVVGREERLW